MWFVGMHEGSKKWDFAVTSTWGHPMCDWLEVCDFSQAIIMRFSAEIRAFLAPELLLDLDKHTMEICGCEKHTNDWELISNEHLNLSHDNIQYWSALHRRYFCSRSIRIFSNPCAFNELLWAQSKKKINHTHKKISLLRVSLSQDINMQLTSEIQLFKK